MKDFINWDTIGDNVSLLRREKGLTQANFAELVGVSDRTISNIENGREVPNGDTLVAICIALECEIRDLAGCNSYFTYYYKY